MATLNPGVILSRFADYEHFRKPTMTDLEKGCDLHVIPIPLSGIPKGAKISANSKKVAFSLTEHPRGICFDLFDVNEKKVGSKNYGAKAITATKSKPFDKDGENGFLTVLFVVSK
jgi:hypothetical protein